MGEGAALTFLIIPLWRLFEALGGKNYPGIRSIVEKGGVYNKKLGPPSD
jgi:hypothetical protein